MRVNGMWKRLRAGETVYGCAIQCCRASEIPRVLAAAGFDYFFLDMEHGGFDIETAQDMVSAAVSSGITPLVRVAELQYALVARLLDVGAQGIVLPRVEEPEVLREALSWMRYPPNGKRGYGVLPPIMDYEQLEMDAIMDHLNDNTCAVVQFETRTALDRADQLLSVPGVQIAMIGPADLSVSLGVPGQFENPILVKAIERFIEKCNYYGVAPGIHCRNATLASAWIGRGMRFIGSGSEISMLIERTRQVNSELRSAVPALKG